MPAVWVRRSVTTITKRKGGGHRTRGFVPHPWRKCRACWHRVDPLLIHHAPVGAPECERAYRAPGGPPIYHKHQGGEPCCPGVCLREDECGRCRDRLPRPCMRDDHCGRCEDRCPPACDRPDGCGRCKDKRPPVCPRGCGRCRDRCPGECTECSECIDQCACSKG